jgi:hypothetical protein
MQVKSTFQLVAAIVILDRKMPEDGERIWMSTEGDKSVVQPLGVSGLSI